MKKKLLPLLLALLLLTLSACGGGSNGAANSAASTTEPSAPQEVPAGGEYGWADANDAPMGEEGEIATDEAVNRANTKRILTAEMDLETKDFDQASQALEAAVEGVGGWFESRSVNQGGSYRRLSCVVRVPAKNFNAFLEQAGQAAHVVSKSDYSEDVSEAYYDSEARLATQRTKLERLQALLAQAASMEDIISLESAISDTELQIEYLTGSLRKYDSLVDYSTVTLYLREVYRLSSDEEIPVTFGQRLTTALSSGLERGIDNLEDFVISVARNWMNLLFLAAVIACAVVLLRWRQRRRRAKNPPPPAPPAPPKDKA